MEISRKAILDKTHYGLTIYSYVLRYYYNTSKTVLSLSGRDCKPTKNPFNKNKPTLIVSIVNNCARHIDTDGSIPNGDVFDFAKLYFKKEGKELYQVINEKLHLRIGQAKNLYIDVILKKPASIALNTQKNAALFSFFSHPISNILPSNSISLLEVYNLIKGNSFASCTTKLRSIVDPKEARKYKAANFDYVTFSGTFSKRNDNDLISHSGLLTIDFDHISNMDYLKESLLNDKYFETELLFISPSGDGIKWIIPIDLTKAKHQEYFTAVSNYIRQTYKLEIDQSGKDISRACFIPHDAGVYINPKYL